MMVTIMTVVWWVLLGLFSSGFAWASWGMWRSGNKTDDYDWIGYFMLSVASLLCISLAWFTIQALKAVG